MEEMHYFKESQREEIPVPDFKDNITRKLLLQFLCDLCTWAQATPVTSVGIKKDAHSLYILFRNFAFSEQDFWQTFGGYLIALRPKWKIGIFGTELSSQETVALLLDQQNGKFYAVQKTISGRYADSIRSLCLRIECANTEDALKISESVFELYDGGGGRRYFSFNSEKNAQRVFLKLLFPLNV